MNKQFLIVLLAVCLVSVQAFVKRDAPAPKENVIENIQKQLQDLSKTIDAKMKETFDADTMKKNVNDFIDKFNKAVNDMKPKQ